MGQPFISAGVCITSMPSGLDNVALVRGVCPGKKLNSMLNWGCVAGVADEHGGTEMTCGEVCEADA